MSIISCKVTSFCSLYPSSMTGLDSRLDNVRDTIFEAPRLFVSDLVTP